MRAWALTALFLTTFSPFAGAEELEAFWVLRLAPGRHPAQERVWARPLAQQGELAVYLAAGTPEPPADHLPEGGWVTVLKLLERALASLPTGTTHEQKRLALLVVEGGWSEAAFSSPFDLLTDSEALDYGFHSNQRPVVYASFPFAGAQAWENLAAAVEQLFCLYTVPKTALFPAASTRAAARWFAASLGLAPLRRLWGDHGHQELGPSSLAPASPQGWAPLFIAFLEEVFGPGTAAELARRQDAPTGPFASLLAAKGGTQTLETMYAAYMARLWEPRVGVNAAPTVLDASPRPHELGRLRASRPTSGHGLVGVGGMGLLVLEGDGGRSLPLSIQADPSARWVAVARKSSAFGLAPAQRLPFDGLGFAQLEVPPLASGERLLVWLAALPDDRGEEDPRMLPVYWGLAWSPRLPVDRRLSRLKELASKKLGEEMPTRRHRVWDLLRVLAGEAPVPGSAQALASRYAWHPQAGQVAELLLAEAQRRGLVARRQPFLRTTPWGATAEWQNVLIELPNRGSRRLPLVLAAHWDACTPDIWDSYRRALGVKDNALGVAAALETASLLRTRPHQLPVIVALLAGGCHDAAGAHALLAALGGQVALWVELDGLQPQRPEDPAKLAAWWGETASTAIPRSLNVFRRWGFSLELRDGPAPEHTGADLAQRQKAMVLTLRHARFENPSGPAVPARAELATTSPEQVLLLAEALAELVQELGGR